MELFKAPWATIKILSLFDDNVDNNPEIVAMCVAPPPPAHTAVEA